MEEPPSILDLRSSIVIMRPAVCLALSVLVLAGCRPTGPTPIEYSVPTAVVPSPAPVASPTQAVPTASPSPEVPTLSPPATAVGAPQPTRGQVATRPGWNTFPLAPGGRVLTPTAGQDAVLWVAPAGPGLGLYLHNLPTGETRLLAQPATAGACVCRGYVQGDWVVMVETAPGATWWEVTALNVVSGDRVAIGRTDDPSTLTALRPGEIAVNSEGVVAWKDARTGADGSVAEILRLRDSRSDVARTVVEVRSPARIAQVSMYANWVVWSQATQEEGGTRGDVFAYDLASGSSFPIGETGRAWEPLVWGTTVVWKHADGPFADGDVFLFDLGAGQGRLLTSGGRVSQVGAGDGFVVWSSALDGLVVRHDLQTGAADVIGRGAVGRLEAGGNTVVWLLDGDPETLHVAWRR